MIPDENDPDQITPVIPWDSIYDNPSESKPGWSFQDDIRNQFPVNGSRWLYDRMFDNESIRQEFMYSGERIRWRRDRFKRYLRQVTAFKEKLAIIIHTSGGQPARAPELLSIRHRNTVNGGRRNIFVENGLMVYVTTYHKGYSISGNTKIIHRYLPKEVGSLLMYYLWLVIPFQRLLETAVYGEAVDSPYLWSQGAPGSQDSKWTSERIRHLIQRESEIGLGQKLNIGSYRQIAIAITRKYLIKDPFIDDREDEDRVDDDDPHGTMPDSAFDLQSGHGSHVAGMIYARWIMEAPQEVASMRERFRQVSRAWHMLLEFPSESANVQAMSKKRKAVTDQPEGIAGEFQRWKKVRSMDPYPVLEQIVGQTGAQFRGKQEIVIQTIMKGQSPICAVMGTSEGKSLLFMLPAMCSATCSMAGQEGVTVVVVPLTTLRQDMKERCDQLRISCVEWNSRRPEEASIVLVTPESAISKTFQSFVMRLKGRNRLDRIVVDECHVVLSSKNGFRPKLQRLGELFITATQFVLLTATLPPQEEHRFWEIMRIPAGEVVMFRSPTSRKNIRYQVVAYDGTDEKAVQFIRAKVQQYAAPGKIVVYSNSVDRVERLAEMLGCPSIHANEEDKAEYFQELRRGEHRVVVATNALGMGVDIPDIRCVVHVDRPRTLLDYGQESGRAGRDRKASEGIIMRTVCGPAPGVVPNPAAEKIEQFMEGDRCRRVVLDQYMDGRPNREGCEEGEEPCDVCHGRRGGVFEDSAGAEDENPQDEADRIEFQRQQRERQWLRERVLRIKSQEAINVEDLAARLEEWEGRCPLCYVRGKPAQGHGLMTCESEGAEEVQEVYQHMKKGVRWEKYSCCFQCGVPQAICDRWERIPDEWGWRQVRPGRCQFPEVVTAVVATIMVEERARLGWTVMEWMRADGIDDRLDQAVYQWFGQRIVWGDIEATRMIQVFYRLATRVVRRVSDSRPGSRGIVSVQGLGRGS
jgi:superfamily II DNA or RNA helicase